MVMDCKINLPSQLCCQLPADEKITAGLLSTVFQQDVNILKVITTPLGYYNKNALNDLNYLQMSITFPCISSLSVSVTFKLPSEAISSLSDILVFPDVK